jgi:glycosyltransferase involved in cell wall biosynthesis
MHLAIDGGSFANARGYGRFTRDLVGAMAASKGARRATLLVDAETARKGGFPDGVDVLPVSVEAAPHVAASADGARSLRDLWAFRRAAASLRPDAVLIPTVYSYFPVGGRAPVVVGFLDAIAETFPNLVFPTRRGRFFWGLKARLAIRRAAAIFTISEASRRDVAAVYGLRPEDLLVVPCDVDRDVFHPRRDASEEARARASFGLRAEDRLLLAVGGLAPHKNLERLVRAFARVAAKPEGANAKLLLIGGGSSDVFHSDRARLSAAVEETGLLDRVVFVGFVPDDRLAILYRSATALCFPSLLEGFGLPALEAMASGTVVLASRRGALPEVVGDLGYMFDPESIDAIAAALSRALSDETERARRAASGPSRAALFRRDVAAKRLWGLLDATVAAERR